MCVCVCVCVLEGVFLLRLAEPLSSILGWCLEKTPFQRQKQKNLGERFFLLSFIFQAWMIKSTVKPKGDGITKTRVC